MTGSQVGLLLPRTDELPRQPKGGTVAEYGRLAESRGFNSVWTPESWGSDSFLDLAEIAFHTESITLGTAIVHVFTRSPAVIAMAAATLSRLADGRAIFGVGVGHPEAIENRHGLEWDRPVRRTHEAIEVIKALTASDEATVSYDGEVFRIRNQPPLGESVPVYNAALGKANRRATGRVADGWLPYNLPFDRLAEAFETVATAAREAGRDPTEIEVAPFVPAAVSDDPDEARDVIRANVAAYLGRFTDESYTTVVRRSFPDATARVADAWRRGDREGAIAAVTDEMVDAMGVEGTPEAARRRFREVRDHSVVDRPILMVPNGASAELARRTVDELAPDRL
jgi:alkanesulfonate monooxygenase SsuD/methylene tetrahydromethanopterin reductase-like flavin-dependent oxidoreductase (luciferase family)